MNKIESYFNLFPCEQILFLNISLLIQHLLLVYFALKNQRDVWSSFIDLNNKIFRNAHYQFSYQLQTDGVGCSLLFIRTDLAENKKWGSKIPVVEEKEYPQLELLDDDTLNDIKSRKIIGCDPGKRSLVYMVDEEGNRLQYTAPQKRIESKAKRNAYVLGIEK